MTWGPEGSTKAQFLDQVRGAGQLQGQRTVSWEEEEGPWWKLHPCLAGHLSPSDWTLTVPVLGGVPRGICQVRTGFVTQSSACPEHAPCVRHLGGELVGLPVLVPRELTV